MTSKRPREEGGLGGEAAPAELDASTAEGRRGLAKSELRALLVEHGMTDEDLEARRDPSVFQAFLCCPIYHVFVRVFWSQARGEPQPVTPPMCTL